MKKAVRIELNGDGSYSAYIYETCVHRGTYEDCRRVLSYHGENAC